MAIAEIKPTYTDLVAEEANKLITFHVNKGDDANIDPMLIQLGDGILAPDLIDPSIALSERNFHPDGMEISEEVVDIIADRNDPHGEVKAVINIVWDSFEIQRKKDEREGKEPEGLPLDFLSLKFSLENPEFEKDRPAEFDINSENLVYFDPNAEKRRKEELFDQISEAYEADMPFLPKRNIDTIMKNPDLTNFYYHIALAIHEGHIANVYGRGSNDGKRLLLELDETASMLKLSFDNPRNEIERKLSLGPMGDFLLYATFLYQSDKTMMDQRIKLDPCLQETIAQVKASA